MPSFSSLRTRNWICRSSRIPQKERISCWELVIGMWWSLVSFVGTQLPNIITYRIRHWCLWLLHRILLQEQQPQENENRNQSGATRRKQILSPQQRGRNLYQAHQSQAFSLWTGLLEWNGADTRKRPAVSQLPNDAHRQLQFFDGSHHLCATKRSMSDGTRTFRRHHAVYLYLQVSQMRLLEIPSKFPLN